MTQQNAKLVEKGNFIWVSWGHIDTGENPASLHFPGARLPKKD